MSSAQQRLPNRLSPTAVAASLFLAFLSFTVTNAEDQSVQWTNMVNVGAASGILQKTAGCDGCDDAGATSQQTVTNGDGFVEFTFGESNTLWAAGLSSGNTDSSYADIDFVLRFNGGGWADILANGVYQSGGDTPYAAGDVFRVASVGGKVQFSRNGVLLYESQRAPQYPFLLDASLASVGATIRNARIGIPDPPPSYGGFLEKAGSPALRSRFTRSQIEAFLPPNGAKGAFTFPAPYYTTAVRLTNASDCAAGQDCVWYTGYSYWRNTNNHVGRPEMLIFLGMDRNYGGVGPSLLSYDKTSDRVQNLGAPFSPRTSYSCSTGEGWYFSGTQPTKLYVFLVGDALLQRYDVLTHQFEATPAMDLNSCPRPKVCPSAATFIYQPHSSDDDLVHSATVQDAAFRRVGCVVYQQKSKRFSFFAPRAGYSLDECHVDKSGRWLMLLEPNQSGAVSNRVVDLKNGATTTIDDVSGSLGHLDMGFGYAVGADNYNPLPNATICWNFPAHARSGRWARLSTSTNGGTLPPPITLHTGTRSRARRRKISTPAAATRAACLTWRTRSSAFSLNAARNADGSLDVLVVGQ